MNAGLCSACAHAREVESSKGSTFTLCQLSVANPRFPRYPMLPVLRCEGYATNPAPTASLVIEFAPGSALHREQDRPSQFPMHRNGPPGTFVLLDDVRISLPTDQIVAIDDRRGAVAIGFGGMRFTGIENGRLTFLRVRDLRPEEQLSPDRSWKMTLEPHWVASVQENGRQVWPSHTMAAFPEDR